MQSRAVYMDKRGMVSTGEPPMCIVCGSDGVGEGNGLVFYNFEGPWCLKKCWKERRKKNAE